MIRLGAALALLLLCAAAGPCDPCAVAGGSYRVAAPPAWDGRRPLPVLLFLHGWMTTPEDVLEDPAVAGPAARAGFLLVAPEGLQKSWAHVGSPSTARDDLAFLREVRADVLDRFAVDRRAVVAAGFSQGSSMVWDLACYAAEDFTAFLSFSGGFWEPLPAACRSGPVRLRHVHGTDDTVMPLAGRALFGPYRQGNVRQGFARWLAEDGCARAPDRTVNEAGLDCDEWTGCAAGRLEFCLRPGGHDIQPATMEGGLRWALKP